MKLFSILFLALLTACAGQPIRNQIDLGYSTVDAYVAGVKNRLLRGATTPAQANADADRAARMKAGLDKAREFYEQCVVASKSQACTDYVSLMNGMQPDLLALEKELRAKEGK